MFNLKQIIGLTVLLTLVVAVQGIAQSITYSFEKPGVATTTESNVITESFTGFIDGKYKTLDLSIGTASSNGFFSIIPTDKYGGTTKEGNYFAFGAQSGSGSPVTLKLNEASNFFGMLWSAADLNNSISFYSNNKLIESFDSTTLFKGLSRDYYGNPFYNYSNTSEPYVYVNFYATEGAQFNTIVFSNNRTTATGFESTNWSVPGGAIVVPEPSTYLLIGTVLFGLLLYYSLRLRASTLPTENKKC